MSREDIHIHISLDAPELKIEISNRVFSAVIHNEAKPLEKLQQILYDFICTHCLAKIQTSNDVPTTEHNNKPSPNELIHKTLQMHFRNDRYSLRKTLTMRKK